MSDIALVTGGAGFLGRHLVAQLLASGTDVRVLDTAPRPESFPASVAYLRGSVLDTAAVELAMQGVNELYHLAAMAHLWYPDPRRYRAVNAEGTRFVLEQAHRAKVRRVVVTSTEVILRGWRDPDPRPITERDHPPRRRDLPGPYAISKAQAHLYATRAQQAGMPLAIVYPTVPIGPGDESLTAPTQLILGLLRGETPAYLDSQLNLVPVEDVARGHILAARRGEPRERYLLGGNNIRLSVLLDMLHSMTGRPMPSRRVPYVLAELAGAISTYLADHVTHTPPVAPLEGVRLAKIPRRVDSSHARQALGWRTGAIDDALQRAVTWLFDAGYLKGSGTRVPGSLILQDN